MTFDEYQQAAARTMNASLTDNERLLDAAAGIAEEAGEVLAHVRKHLYQGKPLDSEKLAEELGDVLWCLAGVASLIERRVEEVAVRNIDKVRGRYPEMLEASVREGHGTAAPPVTPLVAVSTWAPTPRPELTAALAARRVFESEFAARERTRQARHAPARISHFEIQYRQWDGPPLPFAEDFGKKSGQVYSRDGGAPVRSCNEVEVAKVLRTIRAHAFWVSTYNPATIPAIWRPWTIGPPEAPAFLQTLDAAIRQKIGAGRGGVPDVVAWNSPDDLGSALFVECKGSTEDFKETQEDWVTAALQLGVRTDQIAVAVRSFA